MISAWLSARWESLLKWAAIIGGALLLWEKVKQSGKDEAYYEAQTEILKRAKKSKQIETRVDSLSDDALNAKLLEWTRDK